MLIIIRNRHGGPQSDMAQLTLGAASPVDLSPFSPADIASAESGGWSGMWYLLALSSFCDGEDQGNVRWVDVLASRQTHCP